MFQGQRLFSVARFQQSPFSPHMRHTLYVLLFRSVSQMFWFAACFFFFFIFRTLLSKSFSSSFSQFVFLFNPDVRHVLQFVPKIFIFLSATLLVWCTAGMPRYFVRIYVTWFSAVYLSALTIVCLSAGSASKPDCDGKIRRSSCVLRAVRGRKH